MIELNVPDGAPGTAPRGVCKPNKAALRGDRERPLRKQNAICKEKRPMDYRPVHSDSGGDGLCAVALDTV